MNLSSLAVPGGRERCRVGVGTEISHVWDKKVDNGGAQNNPTTKEIPQVKRTGILVRGFQ